MTVSVLINRKILPSGSLEASCSNCLPPPLPPPQKKFKIDSHYSCKNFIIFPKNSLENPMTAYDDWGSAIKRAIFTHWNSSHYSKTCVKQPLKNRQNKDLT